MPELAAVGFVPGAIQCGEPVPRWLPGACVGK